jgi:cephalosporin hydroxylase
MRLLRKGGLLIFLANLADFILSRFDIFFASYWTRGFHRAWFYSGVWSNDVRWFGNPVFENPMDMWVLQEIIFQTRPDFIIESGTGLGGSTLFFAHMLGLLGEGKVITIDVKDRPLPNHPRIIKLIGGSTSQTIKAEVERIVGDASCMVFLDSLHNKQHVLKEMESFHRLVKRGHYLVVADTNANGHPVFAGFSETVENEWFRGGPMEAVQEFLRTHQDFFTDRRREKMLFTFFPSGFLRRKDV